MTNLENLRNIVQPNKVEPSKTGQKQKSGSGESFGNMVHDYLSKVSEDGANASDETQKVLADKKENVHDAMIALEEASLSFQMMLEVRNRMLESYQELKRTQV
jgi:flagellar hook-basal body complex protein FliE